MQRYDDVTMQRCDDGSRDLPFAVLGLETKLRAFVRQCVERVLPHISACVHACVCVCVQALRGGVHLCVVLVCLHPLFALLQHLRHALRRSHSCHTVVCRRDGDPHRARIDRPSHPDPSSFEGSINRNQSGIGPHRRLVGQQLGAILACQQNRHRRGCQPQHHCAA